MTRPSKYLGQRFGRLVCLGPSDRKIGSNKYYWFACDCGKKHETLLQSVVKGTTKSCGCYQTDSLKARLTTHGQSKSKLYGVWAAMRNRCLNPTDSNYHNYGGRGIQLCERWNDFANFLADMGACPDGMQLDRIDNNGPYCPSNCHWVKLVQNIRNRRCTILHTHNGVTKPLAEWAEEFGLSYKCVETRRERGWPPAQWLIPNQVKGTRPLCP